MIQLLGNCFGQEASTLYVGGACPCAAGHTPSASIPIPLENKSVFIHLLVLAMTRPPNRKPRFPIHSQADREYTPARLYIERFSPDFPPVRFSRQNTWPSRRAMCIVHDVLQRRRLADATKNQGPFPGRWPALYRSGLPRENHKVMSRNPLQRSNAGIICTGPVQAGAASCKKISTLEVPDEAPAF